MKNSPRKDSEFSKFFKMPVPVRKTHLTVLFCFILMALPTLAQQVPADATKTDAAKTNAAKTDAAKTDAAKTDAAKTDAAKTDAAKTDAATLLWVVPTQSKDAKSAKVINELTRLHIQEFYANKIRIETEISKEAQEITAALQSNECDDACVSLLAKDLGATEILGSKIVTIGEKRQITFLHINSDGVRIAEESRLLPAQKDLLANGALSLLAKTFKHTLSTPKVAVWIKAEADVKADVFIDGAEVGDTPFIAKLIPGKHEIELREAGKNPWRTQVVLQAGSPIQVQAVFINDTVELWPASVALAGVSALALVGGITVGAFAQLAYNGTIGFEVAPEGSYVHKSPTSSVELSKLAQEITLLSTTANVLYLSAGIFALAAVGTTVADVVLRE